MASKGHPAFMMKSTDIMAHYFSTMALRETIFAGKLAQALVFKAHQTSYFKEFTLWDDVAMSTLRMARMEAGHGQDHEPPHHVMATTP